jgi:anthranilate synthase/indole-3-glycerol phosphate synthase/phosphoribosylanthranilate isomerase
VIKGVLVGEHLMRCENPIEEIHALVTTERSSSSTKEKPLVKICGMVRPEDVLAACKAKVNLIGIIFAEKSPRKVEAEEARKIVQTIRDFRETRSSISFVLPSVQDEEQNMNKKVKLSNWYETCAERIRKACTRGPLSVGVFMDQPIEYVNEMVREVGLDLVQLHGSESWEICSSCIVPVIKVIHVPVVQDLSDHDIIQSVQSGQGHAIAILLDTTIKGGAEGGTGVAFDWVVAKRYKNLGIPVLVAGGLNAENVASAVVEADHPLAVDCSSGVQKSEKSPREKDHTLIQSFIERAKANL